MAPTDPLPVVRYNAKAGERSLDMLRWGLVPFWAKDIKVGFANINAKAEGIDTRPAFREAFQRRRCLVPVDNFFEWKKTANRQAALCDRAWPIAASWRSPGLWENWRSPAGEWVRSFAIVTTTPNELCAEIHNRMPVILKPEAWPAWLGEEPADTAATQVAAGALPVRRDDLLAGEPARRQRQEQRSEPDRADCAAVDRLPVGCPAHASLRGGDAGDRIASSPPSGGPLWPRTSPLKAGRCSILC